MKYLLQFNTVRAGLLTNGDLLISLLNQTRELNRYENKENDYREHHTKCNNNGLKNNGILFKNVET